MHVICTNDKDKPKIVPRDLWIRENELYQVEEVVTDISGELVFKLIEPRLPDIYFPLLGFSSKRFSIVQTQQEGES